MTHPTPWRVGELGNAWRIIDADDRLVETVYDRDPESPGSGLALAERIVVAVNQETAGDRLREISLLWAKQTSQGFRFLADSAQVPAMRDLLDGYDHPDELPEPDDEEAP